MNHTLIQKEIETWLNNLQELSEFNYYCHFEPWDGEPGYSNVEYGDPLSPYCLTPFWENDYYIPSQILIFNISDTEGRRMMLDIPLDGITGPRACFYDKKRNKNIEVELDLSIIDCILSLIDRFPAIFFRDHFQAAIYYSQNNPIKALDELRLSIESDSLYSLKDYNRYFSREFRDLDAFKALMKRFSDRCNERDNNRD